jgi:hypothetical protein
MEFPNLKKLVAMISNEYVQQEHIFKLNLLIELYYVSPSQVPKLRLTSLKDCLFMKHNNELQSAAFKGCNSFATPNSTYPIYLTIR